MSVTRVAAGSVRTVDVIQMRYAAGQELIPPLVRIGGVVGFAGLLLSFLHAPTLCQMELADDRYATAVHLIVPAVQFFLAGGGIALSIAGQVLSGRKLTLGLVGVLAINLATIAVGVVEAQRDLTAR